jgi:hypothetical protein
VQNVHGKGRGRGRRKRRKGWPQGGREVGERYKERKGGKGGEEAGGKGYKVKGNWGRAGMRKKKRMILGMEWSVRKRKKIRLDKRKGSWKFGINKESGCSTNSFHFTLYLFWLDPFLTSAKSSTN